MSIGRLLVFLSVMCTITFGAHYYLWARLVRSPAWPSPYNGILTALLVLLGLLIPAAFIGGRTLPPLASSILAWVAFIWMGVHFLLLVQLLPAEFVRLAAKFGWQAAEETTNHERREFLSRSIAVGIAASTTGLSGFSVFTALRPVAVKKVNVQLAKARGALSGLRIAQLTDVHIGPTIGKAFLEDVVRRTNALSPDLVVVTGDLVDGSVADLADGVSPLADLEARHGVFFVTGNHEYYSGVEEWVEHLGTLGVRVLRNESVLIEHEGEQLELLGVDDWMSAGMVEGHGADLDKALNGTDPERLRILLAHQPRQFPDAKNAGIDLQISGHTHGGQIFPFNYLVKLQQPFVAGLHEVGASKIYVSPGTGYWGPPMRLGIPAEITELTLSA